MSLISSENLLILSNESIDNAHKEFAELINTMETANNFEFSQLFNKLLPHIESHFENENNLMIQSGFPAISEHKAEHQRILGELKQFKKRLDKGMVSFARAYITEKLPSWFVLHLTTMDSALTAHLKTKGI